MDNSSGEFLLAARRANTIRSHSRAFIAERVQECITIHLQRLARNTPRGVRNAHVCGCCPTGCWQQTPCCTMHRPGPRNPAQPSMLHCHEQMKAPRTLVLHRVRWAGAAKGFGEPRGTLPCLLFPPLPIPAAGAVRPARPAPPLQYRNSSVDPGVQTKQQPNYCSWQMELRINDLPLATATAGHHQQHQRTRSLLAHAKTRSHLGAGRE